MVHHILPMTGRQRGIRFYLWLVMKGESDFTCGWSCKGNQILPLVGHERGIGFYLWLVMKGESDFTCGWS